MNAFAYILATIGPVFGILVIGYCAARFKVSSVATGPGLAQFIFTFAIPALIFRTIVKADLGQLDVWPVVLCFFGAVAVVWIAAGVMALILGRSAREAAAFSFGVGFSNVLILCLPIVLNRYGEAGMPPVLVVIALDVPLMWIAATVQIAIAGRAGGEPLHRMLGTLVMSLVRNPVIAASVAGIFWRASGVPIPDVAERFVALLGQAALPGALFALGMTLSGFQVRGAVRELGVMLVLKLIALPALVWVLATYVFMLQPLVVAVLTLAAACPTGVNAYLFAARYDVMTRTVAGGIAISTALSAITLSVILALVS